MRLPAVRPSLFGLALLAFGGAALDAGADVKAGLGIGEFSFTTVFDPTAVPGMDLGVPSMFAGLLSLRSDAHAGLLVAPQHRNDQAFEWLARQLEVVAKLEGRLLQPAETGFGYMTYVSQRPNDAHRIILRTLVQQSGEWRHYFWLGYLYYAFYNDADKTVEWWRLASLFPGAPPYLPNLVQLVRLQDSGRLDPLLADVQRSQMRDPVLQREFELMQAFEQDAQNLNRDLRRYRDTYGRPSTTPQQLVEAGFWPHVPKDPWGGPVRIDAAGGFGSLNVSNAAAVALYAARG